VPPTPWTRSSRSVPLSGGPARRGDSARQGGPARQDARDRPDPAAYAEAAFVESPDEDGVEP
ncbi:hypothetical protein ACWCXL_07400, partial [Streptomyces sp. NPDC001588]